MPFRPEVVTFDADEKHLLKTVGASKKAVTDAVSKALGDSARSFSAMSRAGYIALDDLNEAIAEAQKYQRTLEGLPETETLLEIREQVEEACTLLEKARQMLANQ